MSFKYINPGYISICDKTSREHSSGNDDKFSSGIYTSPNADFYINIPTNIKSLYAITEIQYTRSCSNRMFYINNGTFFNQSNVFFANTSNASINMDSNIHRMYIEYNFSSTTSETNGSAIAYFDGKKILENDNISLPNTGIFYMSKGTDYGVLMSGIIISDEKLDINEKVMILTSANTTTDMTSNSDGTYTATAIGQSIMQTINNPSVGISKITGLAVAANPGYYVDSGLTMLVGQSKIGDTVTEHGIKSLTPGMKDGVVDGWSVDMSTSDLSGISLGWKSGA